MYNFENESDPITYYALQKVVKENKHIKTSYEYPSDDCRCEHCENVELFLAAMLRHLRKQYRADLITDLSGDPAKFLEVIIL